MKNKGIRVSAIGELVLLVVATALACAAIVLLIDLFSV